MIIRELPWAVFRIFSNKGKANALFLFYFLLKRIGKAPIAENKKQRSSLYQKSKNKKEENTCGGIFFVIRGKMKATEVQLCLKIRDRTNLWHL